MKDKIWLFILGIRLVDDEIQMPQPELVSVAEIEFALRQKFSVHSCVTKTECICPLFYFIASTRGKDSLRPFPYPSSC